MNRLPLEPPAVVHLIGICGTGMGALAGLLVEKGYTVTGSDLHAYPPMSEELERLGISVMEGYRASNLDHRPDLVVVGNVCRPDHPEAVAAAEMGLLYKSMPGTVRDLFLSGARSLVIAGTHGKTTTTALTSHLLDATGRDPSFLAGGVIENFGFGYRVGSSDLFVIEGDEYDSAYFEKVAKFLSYKPLGAVITSVEHDHIDIYPTFEDYKNAFVSFAKLVPPEGILAVWAGDPIASEIAQHTEAEVVTYAVEGDQVEGEVHWRGIPVSSNSFDLIAAGETVSSIDTPIIGNHNLRNTLAAMILCRRIAGVPIAELTSALGGFKGVRRRQQVLGSPGQVTILDDFAHHPTAVKETLSALTIGSTSGRLIAAFEPRSATACRALHQRAYVEAFDSADRVILAPPGRQLPKDERLDTSLLAEEIGKRGIDATAASSLDDVLRQVKEYVRPGDKVAFLSNGAFGGLSRRLLEELS